MRLFELFNSTFPLSDINHDRYGVEMQFDDSQGHTANVTLLHISPKEKSIWLLGFDRNDSDGVTGDGEEFKVFSTVIEAAKQMIADVKPKALIFTAVKAHGARASLYRKMMLRFAATNGFSVANDVTFDPDLQEIKERYSEGEEVFILLTREYQA